MGKVCYQCYCEFIPLAVKDGKVIQSHKGANKRGWDLTAMVQFQNLSDYPPNVQEQIKIGKMSPENFMKTIPSIIPKDYYICSGEAIKKLEKLITDCQIVQNEAQKALEILKQCKGEEKWLETTWINGRLIIKPQSPQQKAKDLELDPECHPED